MATNRDDVSPGGVNYPPQWQRPSVDRSGEPPHDGGMEARVAKLEATSEHILRELVEMKTDIRELRKTVRADLLWMISGFATMLLVMAHGFHWL